ncbi:MAG: GNAT family N-acetyltransferase [Aliiglaciecola sp.]|uniref:GNAT family N-acetyltransferase n=1 Tax=Aliiglaciecola sp. M165 TaxID=2593649 RepID=UPI0011810B59|nr:GNAT family N-acetyltransferase [Aliiglaciecola sp. M165]TRY29350.1 GNAT family N-acetyltransferase [Aliiglaciecola sp. M165]
MEHKIYRFEELSPELLYSILRLRESVFVIEQQSIYEDIDGLDQEAWHLCIFDKEQLIGYLRLRLIVEKDLAKIERVVVDVAHRSKGAASFLMKVAMQKVIDQTEFKQITLSAQTAVLRYYQKLGFVAHGDTYLDGGIPHIDMSWTRQL